MIVLFIGAHPDDIEIGAGGALLKHLKRGDKVGYIVFSRGEKGCSHGDSCNREQELMNVARSLGLNYFQLHSFPDTRLHEHFTEIKDILEDTVLKMRPDRVYTHSLNDSHQDHAVIAKITKIVCRRVPQVLSYWSPSSYNEFHPVYFVDITDVFAEKIKLLENYKSQGSKDYLKRELVYSVNKYMGFLAGTNFAEGFEVLRYVEL